MARDETSSVPEATPHTGSERKFALERPVREYLVRELLQAMKARTEDAEKVVLPEPAEALALLRDAIRERATDIHLDSQINGLLVRMRIDGLVLDGALLSFEVGLRLINQFLTMGNFAPGAPFLPKEGRFTCRVDDHLLDLRLSRAPCLRGDILNIRVLMPDVIPLQLHELGLHEQGLEHIHEWLDDVSGVLLVAGPTGSGKTTTLYALLHRLKQQERNIITIEDPVEYEIAGINHLQIDERHGFGFPEAVKAMLRLDPDYLMVGEIRDAASAHAAISAASSGRALISTMHSRDAVGVIDALRNYGLAGHEIAANLMLVVAQRLVRKLCLHCRVKTTPTEEETRWLAVLKRKVPAEVWHAQGCERCHGDGYDGRTGVFEVWRIHRDDYQLILEEADRRRVYRQLAERNHFFLLDKGLEKVEAGITTLAELRSMGGFSALPSLDWKEK